MTRGFQSPLFDFACLLLPTLWFGLIVGASFVATPCEVRGADLDASSGLGCRTGHIRDLE